MVGFNIWIKITFTCRGWGFATDHKLPKLQLLQNKVFHTIAKFSKLSHVSENCTWISSSVCKWFC